MKAVVNDKIRSPRVLEQLNKAITESPGATLKSAKGTWWGAVNAVSFVIDHDLGRTRDTALYKAWMGRGAATKRRAVTNALEYAKKAA